MRATFRSCLGILCAAFVFISAPTRADYVFDPADLPAGFACDEKTSEADCIKERRNEAWWRRYGENYGRWFDELLYNTNIYFHDLDTSDGETHKEAKISDKDSSDPDAELGYETPNLVDAHYRIALRRFSQGWAFAIDMVCPEPTKQPRSCAPKLRMVSLKRLDEMDEQTKKKLSEDLLPTSRPELAAQLRMEAKWQEADLRTCPGALEQLLGLPAQRGQPIWAPGYVKWLRGKVPKEPDELIVTADGAGVFLRAKSAEDPENPKLMVGGTNIIYSQWNGGEGMHWALEMVKIVGPCLKPAEGLAPWDKIVANPRVELNTGEPHKE